MFKLHPLSLLCFIASSPFLASGCGGATEKFERVVVSGAVLFDGKPVPYGSIWFEPDLSAGPESPTGFASIRDGKFQTTPEKSPKAGMYTMRISGAAQSREELARTSGNDEAIVEPLFREYTQSIEIPETGTAIEVTIPKGARKSP